MRLTTLATLVAAGAALLAAAPVKADGFHTSAPAGYGETVTVRRWVFQPRYRTVHHIAAYGEGDPYAYRYSPRGYYPYYASRYWRPRGDYVRPDFTSSYRYYPAWGLRKPGYDHRRWHADEHGRHHYWHW